ncbi:hypothetical protein L3X38_014131 [Prunus dulcis]|uniref:Uncharacterized protein n=1 Tax=Prunus dulcis TaxID=3755 RepID=A0AAD4ZGT7_PRUDU|nr:hypothetical protein L3X38_014131 [Prunus dulcis]
MLAVCLVLICQAHILMELLTSQKAFCEERPESDKHLASFFLCSVEESRLDQILEGEIIKGENLGTAKKVAGLAKRCLGSRNERPSMKEVATKLEVLRFMEWHYSAAGMAKLNFSQSPKKTDNLLGSPSQAQVLEVRRGFDEFFGSCGIITAAELYNSSAGPNQIQISVEA